MNKSARHWTVMPRQSSSCGTIQTAARRRSFWYQLQLLFKISHSSKFATRSAGVLSQIQHHQPLLRRCLRLLHPLRRPHHPYVRSCSDFFHNAPPLHMAFVKSAIIIAWEQAGPAWRVQTATFRMPPCVSLCLRAAVYFFFSSSLVCCFFR